MRTHARAGAVAGTVLALGVVPPVLGDDGFDWVTIGDAGNVAYSGPPDAFGLSGGRGSVDYEYRISRLEITTGQWLEFVNTFGQDLPGIVPFRWGAEFDSPSGSWRLRSGVATPEMLPVGGVSWEDAAQYVNWLHNGKRGDVASTQSGVYDTSTFTGNPDGTFNHQIVPSPGAKYWIPNIDEWLKAAHYDPDRFGSGEGGWWLYNHSSDDPPVPGVPGVGETMAFTRLPGNAHWDVPLGAYPDVQSPWGLLDLTGGTHEWISTFSYEDLGFRSSLLWSGTAAGSQFEIDDLDRIDYWGSNSPWAGGGSKGIRLASRVPPPVSVLPLAVLAIKRSRRKPHVEILCNRPDRLPDSIGVRAGERHLRRVLEHNYE